MSEWAEDLTSEVKISYRLIQTCGLPDVNATEFDSEFVSEVDTQFESWLRRVKENAWAEGYGDCWAFHQSSGLTGRESNPYGQEPRGGRDVEAMAWLEEEQRDE
ncbi:hypothetical protein [Gulosibacter sp. 10]|uniref:hypothetical protein n=1 Tax=Gulosibacter sp. 10 TaxID=1255570 RepID=UPI00112311AA|nr:hypothetical protein [Gulosibacter sp. 10]